MSNNWTVELTSDGSPTVYSRQFGTHFHSIHGALRESRHVYIQSGLHYYNSLHSKSDISILEYGMGSALNVLLTQEYAEKNDIQIRYHTLEGHPIPKEIYTRPEFDQYNIDNRLRELHELEWSRAHDLSPNMSFRKDKILFENFNSDQVYDIIYFDAFGPRAQPELWTLEILSEAYKALNKGGILVTFCAQGAFKRILKSLGCNVERIPGPPGKREITRATKE